MWRSSFLWRSYLLSFSLVGIAVVIGGWWGALAAMGIGAVLLYWSTRNVISPLSTIADAAQAMARGSYGYQIAADELDEGTIADLGQALNSISGELAQRLNAIAHDRGISTEAAWAALDNAARLARGQGPEQRVETGGLGSDTDPGVTGGYGDTGFGGLDTEGPEPINEEPTEGDTASGRPGA